MRNDWSICIGVPLLLLTADSMYFHDFFQESSCSFTIFPFLVSVSSHQIAGVGLDGGSSTYGSRHGVSVSWSLYISNDDYMSKRALV